MIMNVFQAGKGINANKINNNFSELQQICNANETAITSISDTALLKDGSNLTQSIIDAFKQETPIVISVADNITLSDNSTYFLNLTGNGRIILPTVGEDPFSHTIILIVAGNDYSLDLGTQTHLYNPLTVDTTKTYNVMYIYNKIEKRWDFSLTQ